MGLCSQWSWTWVLVSTQCWDPLWAQVALPGDNKHTREGSQEWESLFSKLLSSLPSSDCPALIPPALHLLECSSQRDPRHLAGRVLRSSQLLACQLPSSAGGWGHSCPKRPGCREAVARDS